jgi:hypothetical protein
MTAPAAYLLEGSFLFRRLATLAGSKRARSFDDGPEPSTKAVFSSSWASWTATSLLAYLHWLIRADCNGARDGRNRFRKAFVTSDSAMASVVYVCADVNANGAYTLTRASSAELPLRPAEEICFTQARARSAKAGPACD